MSNWIAKSELPKVAAWVDIWDGKERITDVWYENRLFLLPIEDHQGDFSHHKQLEVTHWMYTPEQP